MVDAFGAGGAVFGTVGLCFALIGIALGTWMIRTMVSRKRILTTGIQVEARCLDTFQRSSSDGPGARHAILAFTTREGREIRIQPAVTGPIVPGDFVPVRYDPARPASAVLLGTGADTVANGCGMVVVLLTCAVFVVVGLSFALGGFGLLAATSSISDPSGFPNPSFGP